MNSMNSMNSIKRAETGHVHPLAQFPLVSQCASIHVIVNTDERAIPTSRLSPAQFPSLGIDIHSSKLTSPGLPIQGHFRALEGAGRVLLVCSMTRPRLERWTSIRAMLMVSCGQQRSPLDLIHPISFV